MPRGYASPVRDLIFGRELSTPRDSKQSEYIQISLPALSGLAITERRELLSAKVAKSRAIVEVFQRELDLSLQDTDFITTRLGSDKISKYLGPKAPTNGYAYKISLGKDGGVGTKHSLIFWAPMKAIVSIKNDEKIFYLAPEGEWLTWQETLTKAKGLLLNQIK